MKYGVVSEHTNKVYVVEADRRRQAKMIVFNSLIENDFAVRKFNPEELVAGMTVYDFEEVEVYKYEGR